MQAGDGEMGAAAGNYLHCRHSPCNYTPEPGLDTATSARATLSNTDKLQSTSMQTISARKTRAVSNQQANLVSKYL